MVKLLAEYVLGDICAQYRLDEDTDAVGLELLPLGWQARRQSKRQKLDPLVQLMIRGDDFPPAYSNGHTMRGNGSLSRFRYKDQQVLNVENCTSVTTWLCSGDGQEVSHRLTHYAGEAGVEIVTAYHNNGSEAVTLDMLSSFCMGGITPFIADDAPESMVLHRLRSKWSNEGRLDSIAIEDLQLEPTWAAHGVQSEKFGQIGSLPVRAFFPFAAVEDTVNHVLWGVQLACPSSWQIEVYRKDDGLCISGGLADYDFGHWCKTLKPGESFTAPVAYMSVCEGDIDKLCSGLTAMHTRALEKMENPECLPVIFNEFCTTWGQPSHENIKRALESLKGHDIDYFVIDSGWYADEAKGWEANMGDWQINPKLFPDGMEAVVSDIRDSGFKPGIWFEPEVCGRDANAFKQTEHLLKRHGTTITTGSRRFWDMRDDWVSDYLEERVIGLLKRYGFDYIKIDYNDSIGVGCDGAESLGEGLRQNMLASRAFLEKIRGQIPGIIVENCSSGGHRLEPSLLGVCQLASFSDAHEEVEIPLIAANLHRAMLPSQSLIWAVLRKDDSPRRLTWSVCATFLGVMCLSGDIYDLTPEQWEIVDRGIKLYRMSSHIIQDGVSVLHGPKITSYRHPKGWQAIERTSVNGREKLIVIHVFDEADTNIRIDLGGKYRLCGSLADDSAEISCRGGRLSIRLTGGACALYLRNK